MRSIEDPSRRSGRRLPVNGWRRLLLLPLLLLVGGSPVATSPLPSSSSANGGADAADLPLPTLSPAYEVAARAVREGDYEAVRETLEQVESESVGEASRARVVLGLAAHALERIDAAAELLSETPVRRGGLDDWRLWILADVEAARGEHAAAQRALDELLTHWPDSILTSRAVVRAAEIAWQRGDDELAARYLEMERGLRTPAELAERAATLGWTMATDSGSVAARRDAAQRLLVEHPIAASERSVVEVFRHRSGLLEWADFLTPAELLRRTENLIAAGISAGALTTLDAVPSEWRSLQWHLLRARALTMEGEGRAALAVLAPLTPVNRSDSARLARMRARAALRCAEIVPGGDNLSSSDRDRYRREALGHLEATADLAVDDDVATEALESLFVESADTAPFERLMVLLRRLQRVAPSSDTGAKFLWERGWREYRDHNYSGAIGYWSELLDLAPSSDYARGGRYWTARAFDALGQSQRARTIYRGIAEVPTADFYARHAEARLGEDGRADRPLPHPAEPWPTDRWLRRARLLSDLGLDELALVEIDLREEKAVPRAVAALRGLVRARAGEPRKSIPQLRRAFPALGTTAQARVPRAALELYYPLLYADVVDRWARHNRLPKSLVFGVIRQESAFDAGATSWAGARGLMQLMPATARELAQRQGLRYWRQRLYDPDFSLRLGTSYLRQVLDMFDGHVELALAGYNGGPYRIKRLWRRAETRQLDLFIEGLDSDEPRTYVKRILLWADSYDRLYPEAT